MKSFEARFWAKVDVVGESECWPWLGKLRGSGSGTPSGGEYGMFADRQAHRISYERVIGVIPGGYVVDHTCDHKWCVNPNHLEAVTNGENVRRAWVSRKKREAANEAQ